MATTETLTHLAFPAGTTLEAYARTSEVPNAAGLPAGRPVLDTSTVAADRSVTFDGLPEGGEFWAVGLLDGVYRWVAFSTDPPITDVETVDDRVDGLLARVVELETLADASLSGVDVTRHGVLPGLPGQAAAFQALADSLYATRAARGSYGDTIVFPAGNYSFNAELTYYVESGYCQNIVGQGMATRLTWSADLGAKKIGLRPSKSRSGTQKPLLRDFMLRGNPVSSAWAMDGLALASGGTAENVYNDGGFRANFIALNDHTHWFDCESHGGTYNLLFGYQYQAKDNHIIRGGNYTDGYVACIAVAGNNTLGGSELSGFHVGNSPRCFYKLSATDTANFETFNAEPMDAGADIFFSSNECVGLRLENTEVRIFDAANAAAGSQIQDNVFIGCDQGGSEYFPATYQGAFRCDSFSGNTFIRATSLLDAGIDKAVHATTIIGNRVLTHNAHPSWLLANELDTLGGAGWHFEDGWGSVFKVIKADEAIAAGDVLMGWVGGWGGSCKKFDSTQASASCGVARDTVASGSYLFRQLRGYCSRVNIAGGAAPDSQHYLVPSTTAGKATHVATGVAASAQPIGRALSGDLGGYCQAELTI